MSSSGHSTVNPQNPYQSFIVEASAGSGKTYQLSRRFLMLVGAGADPAAILTVTFTKKAASEMRGRILADATALLAEPDHEENSAKEQFSAELAAFYKDLPADKRALMPPPRGPEDVAVMILGASQKLRISTIDSLFYEWVSEFPLEASGALTQTDGEQETNGPVETVELGATFSILNTLELKELDQRAWRATSQYIGRKLRAGDEFFQQLIKNLPGCSLQEAKLRLERLKHLETYLWHTEKTVPDSLVAFRAHTNNHQASGADLSEQLMEDLAPSLVDVATQITNANTRGKVEAAIRARDFNLLLESGLLTKKEHQISGSLIRGVKRDLLAAEIQFIDSEIRDHLNKRLLAQLDREGATLYQLYSLYMALRQQLKIQASRVDFNDLTKSCFRLFREPEGIGARYIIARRIQHVMMDEFQDTSQLQWSIFAEMLNEILAGEGLGTSVAPLPPTAFIVGDPKQSIFGFREADPTVMSEAAALFDAHLVRAPLHHSFRTAQVVLDYVNRVFADGRMARTHFPPHNTAVTENLQASEPFIPNIGSVHVLPLVMGEAEVELVKTDETAVEIEARLVADFIAKALAQPHLFPVYDKSKKVFRPLRIQDCAVLYRAASNADVYAQALRAVGIACAREEERGFFSRSEISDAMALLKWLALPADTIALATVLRSPMGGLSDHELLDLLIATRHRNGQGDKGDEAEELATRSQRMLTRLAASPTARLSQLAAHLQALLSDSASQRPHELLTSAFARLQIYKSYENTTDGQAETQLIRRNLFRLIELCLDLEKEGFNSPLALHQHLLQLIEQDEHGNASGGRAVTLMTVHKSKGLEFPLVALVDTARSWGKGDAYWAKSPRTESPGIYYLGKSDQGPREHPEFERLQHAALDEICDESERLLYVALTRARHHLVISGHQAKRTAVVGDTLYYDRLQQAAVASSPAAPSAAPSSPDREAIRVYRAGEVEGIASRSGHDDCASIPPVGDLSLPHELKLVAPSSLETRDPTESLEAEPLLTRDPSSSTTRAASPSDLPQELRRKLAIAQGLYIHKGLELNLRGRASDFDAAQQYIPNEWAVALRQAGLAVAAADSYIDAASLAHQDLDRLLNSALWSNLIADAIEVLPEIEIVHKLERAIVRGSIDLLLRHADGSLTVVDYKTTDLRDLRELLGDAPSEVDLQAFCRRQGYSRQLNMYREAVAQIYEVADTRQVRTKVLFTKSQQLIELY